jgi:hypothetical protein
MLLKDFVARTIRHVVSYVDLVLKKELKIGEKTNENCSMGSLLELVYNVNVENRKENESPSGAWKMCRCQTVNEGGDR